SGRGTARLAELSTRLGDVFRVQLGQPTRAVTCYDTALTADPGHAGARAGLLATLETEGRPGAVEALSKLYRARGEWTELAAIADARLAGTSDPVLQVEILRETARLHEQHGHDKEAALARLARALPLAPGDRGLERDLVRLSEETANYRVAAEAYHSAAEVVAGSDGHRAAELRLAEARIAEHKLGDAGAALLAYQAVLAAVRG